MYRLKTWLHRWDESLDRRLDRLEEDAEIQKLGFFTILRRGALLILEGLLELVAEMMFWIVGGFVAMAANAYSKFAGKKPV